MKAMSAQLLAVYVLIGLAGLFVARATVRTWFTGSKAGCGSGCGKCPAAPTAEPVPTKRIGLPMAE